MSWINKAVIYQINLRSLAMREPRNAIEAVGEKPNDESPLAYVTRHLGKIKRLGVNTLYLMPPYPSGQLGRKGIGSPYAIRDFKAVDPEYGTLDELKSFVRTAQAKRLRVILDLTPNHTSRDNVWVAAHPEYYFQNDDGELLWDFDWTDTAKLNYGHDDMRRAMTDVLDYWLGFLGTDAGGIPAGIDGYRLDMAHLISDLRYWNEAIAELRQRHNSRELLFLAESYGASNNLDLFGRGFNAAYDDDLYKCMVYGYGRDQDGESVISLSDEAPGNADFALMLAAYRQGGMAAAVAESLMRYERELPAAPAGPWLARYTDNHDEGRGLYRFGSGAVRAFSTVAFLSGHALPFLLTGQEFGAENRPPIHERLALCDKGFRRIRPEGTIAVEGIEYEGNSFARGVAARTDWYAFYRDLIALRKAHRELTHGRFVLLELAEDCPPAEQTVLAFERRHGKRALCCAINLGPERRSVDVGQRPVGRMIYGALTDGIMEPFATVVWRPGNGVLGEPSPGG